jgi:hypothetical protein
MPEPGAIPVREGDLLAGKYRVERVLGVGGMGIVVAARHEQLEQRVAIKFVRDEALDNKEAVERFLREARAAVRLKSEHAAKVLDVGTLESGAPYMVMEFLEGSDLAAVLVDRGPLPVEEAAEYVLQACEAVAEAHAAGIVHRDLKPQNLFLARTVGGAPRVKVLDFGVSKSLTQSGGGPGPGGKGALTQTRSMLGSPLYMSPEQMRSSRDVDARSDVWAFGVVLFELLTRRWPFEAETMPELCLKVVSDPPQSLAELRPGLPPEFIAIVERCLQRDPAMRFANAAELASALEPFVPVASRVVAERARLAMGATTGSGRTASPGATSLAHAPTAVARTGPTPAAWGSRQGASPAPEPKRRSAAVVWVGVVATVAVLGAGAVMLLRPHAGAAADDPARAATPTTTATAGAAAGAGAAGGAATGTPSPAATGTGGILAPMASAAPSATAAGSASTTASAGTTSTAAPTAATAPHLPPAVVKPGASSRVSPGGKPKPNDDDIPSLR